MTIRSRQCSQLLAALCCVLALTAAGAPAQRRGAQDPLEPARAALRTLQFNRAIELLTTSSKAGNPEAQYLLGLIFLNGVGTASDTGRAKALLQSAAEHGHGAAAYVLAGELSHGGKPPSASAHEWLEHSAKLGYVRAVEALESGRPLLDRESVGATDPAFLTAWVIDRVRRNDVLELRRLGKASATVHDDFGRSSLSRAAEAGTVEAAALLLELGADIHDTDKAGTTALMIAAERPNRAMVALLLQNGADPQAADTLQRTAIFYAARANQPATVRSLKEAGAKLDAQDERGYNALDDALTVGAEESASELRSLGLHSNLVPMDLGRQTGKFDPAHPGEIYRGWPPIALAAARNDVAGVRQQLDAGISANLRVPQGDSVLQIAADAHAEESLALLMARGANATSVDHTGHTILWLAAVRGDLPIVNVLLAGGVPPDTHSASEKNPLLAALRATHSDIAAALLSGGAKTEATDSEGRTALMLAAANKDLALVQALLGKGARTDRNDHKRRTALWYAAATGSRPVVDALLAAGGIQAVTDVEGLSILHAAAGQAEPGVLEPLLTLGTRINARSVNGDTPLLIAASKGHTELVRAMLARSPDLDSQNAAGDTALMAASRGGYASVCQLLVAAGANVGLRNLAGQSAADIAAQRGFALIAKELSDKG
jgi:ankyrin repeat protein